MKKIALYLDNLDEDYQISIYREIKRETLSRGINFLCIQGGNQEGFDKLELDGVIFLSTVLRKLPIKKPSVPTISIGNIIQGVPSIVINSKNSINALMDHLLDEHCYRNFLFFGGPKDHPDNIEREEAFINTLETNNNLGISYDIINGDFYQNSGTTNMKQYIRKNINKKIDVIVCASDHIAIGVKKAIDLSKHQSWKNVKITGYDDITSRETEFPGLTTVKQPIKELAHVLLENISKLIDQEDIKPVTYIDCVPVFRTSCGCKDKEYKLAENKSIDQYSSTLNYFYQNLTRVESYNELLEHLKGLLEMININKYYLLLSDTTESSRLIYKKQGSHEEININHNTNILDLFTDSKAPSSYIFYHLYSRKKEIGVVIYDCEESVLSHMCTSCSFMANIVNQLRTLEMEKKRSNLLEVEVSRRTSALVETNRVLELEISRRIEVEAEVLKISELERKRFSLDLHDDICQRLAGISMYAKSFSKSSELGELCELLDDTLLRTRKYAHNSFPMELNSLGLKRSIKELCYALKKQSSIEVLVVWDDHNFSSKEQINIFRITQEALHNSIKHSNASNIDITGELTKNNFDIKISDNGIGQKEVIEKSEIDQLKRIRPNGLGLKSMEYRAHQIGAIYNYSSVSGEGTTISLIIPV